MTRNDTPDKLEWSFRPRSGVDLAQWDWGMTKNSRESENDVFSVLSFVPFLYGSAPPSQMQ